MADGGDFDLIVTLSKDSSDLAFFEFKRIKIKANNQYSDKINKLELIGTLCYQLEDRVKLGFMYVYGIIILHGDLAMRDHPNTIMKSYSYQTYEQIFKASKDWSLLDQAGLLFCKFDHPTTNPGAINFYVAKAKSAFENKQNNDFFEIFKNYTNKNGV